MISRRWAGLALLACSATLAAACAVRSGPGAGLPPGCVAGLIEIRSTPSGAQILIDGEPFDQRTPAVIPQLAIGTHTVQLRREGSEDWSQAVVVAQDRTVEVQALLAPARNSLGTLAVQSQPPRAAISLDGYPSGKLTPERLVGISPGSHLVGLVLDGYRSWSGMAVVRAAHTENLLVTLRPLPPQESGSARIETDPPGAAITLNGVVLRTKTPALLERLAPGKFPVVLSRPGSHPWEGELAVLPGECALLQVRLESEAQ